MPKKNITIMDFLTEAQLQQAFELRSAELIREQIIEPNIDEINSKLGQENDPAYLAYAVEYVLTQLAAASPN